MNSRHNRTELFLRPYIDDPRNFFSIPVMITAGADVLDTANGRMMLETAVNLIGRFVDKLAIRVPSSRPEIASSMKKLAGAIGCEIENDEKLEPSIVFSVGPTCIRDEFTIQIDSFGWVSHVSCNSDVETLPTSDENPVGALGAACFGAAEVFKRLLEMNGCEKEWIIDHPRQTRFSFLDYTLSSNNRDFPRKPIIGKTLLVGAGAVGSGFLHTLSKIDGLQGDVVVLDYDAVDRTNLNRCLPYFVNDVGKPKASVCERLSNGRLNILGCPVEYDAFQKQDGEFPVIVSTVDNNDARFAIQHDLPKLIFHAATYENVSAVSVIRLLENACLCCIFKNNATHEEIISNETGIPIDVVTAALAQGSLFTEEHYGFMLGKLQDGAVRFRDSIGKPFEDVYQKQICGALNVETDEGEKTPSVPFVSFFAGLCAASELIKYRSKSFGNLPMMNRRDYLEADLFSPRMSNLAHRVKEPDCSMSCSSRSIQEHFSNKWQE